MAGISGDDDEAKHYDPLSLSYIAVLCCGLAGALVLFLVFSTMPHEGTESPGRSSDVIAANDRVPGDVGVRLDNRSRAGIVDLVGISVDVASDKLPLGSISWPGVQRSHCIARECGYSYGGGTGVHMVFWSPIRSQRRQEGKIRIVVKSPHEPLPDANATIVMFAGGSRKEIEISMKLPPDESTTIGEVNFNDKGGPTKWFSPNKSVTKVNDER